MRGRDAVLRKLRRAVSGLAAVGGVLSASCRRTFAPTDSKCHQFTIEEMAKTYRLGPARRAVNVLYTRMVRRGRGPSFLHPLTVRGRRTGEPRSTPLSVMELDHRRYLVAPYGPVGWVKNARVAGEVSLTRGDRTERFTVRELGPEEAVPLLRKYLREIKAVRPYFDVSADSPEGEFRGIAPSKPVFELTPRG